MNKDEILDRIEEQLDALSVSTGHKEFTGFYFAGFDVELGEPVNGNREHKVRGCVGSEGVDMYDAMHTTMHHFRTVLGTGDFLKMLANVLADTFPTMESTLESMQRMVDAVRSRSPDKPRAQMAHEEITEQIRRRDKDGDIAVPPQRPPKN